MPVRLVQVLAEDSGLVEDEDSEGDAEVEVVKGERLRLLVPKDNEFVRKVRDPRLPTQEDVEEHYVRAHIPYRD